MNAEFNLYTPLGDTTMQSLIRLALLLFLQTSTVLASPQTPTPIDDGWEVASPESVALNAKTLNTMTYMVRKKYTKVDSLLIARSNKLIYEQYFNESKQNKPHELASASKSIISILIGIAIDQKKIKSAQQSIYELFPYKQYKHWDDRKKDLSLHHLLTMTAGWECGGWGLSRKNKCGPMMYKQKEPYKFILDLPMQSKPGAKFHYNDAVPAILVAALMLSTQQLYLDFYYNELLKPLGIKKPNNSSALTSRDMLKIGQLFLNKGQWRAKQIVSEAWVNKSTSAQHLFDHDDPFKIAKAYGYFWWLNDFQVNEQLYPYYLAAGNGGQYIFVIPKLELVIVMTGQYYGEDAPGRQLVLDYILPAISSHD